MSDDKQTDDFEKLDEAAFTQRVKELLDAEVDNLNAPVRSKLNQARQAALDELPEEKQGWFGSVNWGPVSAVTMVCLMGVFVWLFDTSTIDPDLNPVAVTDETEVSAEDIEILFNETDLEMMADLDFYAWLEEELGSDEDSSG